MGGLELNPIIIQALQMGDELHNRHSASSSLFANKMAIALGKNGFSFFISSWTERLGSRGRRE
jgi:hypothetical protein